MRLIPAAFLLFGSLNVNMADMTGDEGTAGMVTNPGFQNSQEDSRHVAVLSALK